MTEFLDHLRAEMQALERSLESDPRYIKLRELKRVRALYEGAPQVAIADSPERGETPARLPRERRPAPREMSPETKRVIAAAHELMDGRTDPFPLRALYHEIAEVRGVRVGGKSPINNLSAMLYRYGFEAVGRTGWRVRQDVADDTTSSEPEPEPDPGILFSAHAPNGAAHEIHGAATI